MGVPAFYRWLSEKYPKVVEDILEERVKALGDGSSTRIPFDATKPNPSGLECDNLYIDMNGIIHPCSHPENGPQPSSEEEMYENVCRYVDRLFRAHRPRHLLYLAIDGVAPRAKMNQQRARRFRSAQEAREQAELEEEIRASLPDDQRPPKPKKAWDSNVITPGTPFMLRLSEYIRFYIRKRLAQDKAWQSIRVLFSDASIPGEGEHKIMAHVRLQRSQPGYNPNLVHVLHGLDADLIMLALATHEAHFFISRELVLFGRKSQETHERRLEESGFKAKQQMLDTEPNVNMGLEENSFSKPLQRVNIAVLREYFAVEFQTTLSNLTFPSSLERLIDDIVFLCFFVGNDFLPHLPSLDIRDGALDYLFNVYKRLLPTFGDYLTNHGGVVNLQHVDVILGEVGSIEDYVFAMKHESERREEQRRKDHALAKKRGRKGPPPPPDAGEASAPSSSRKVVGKAAKIVENHKQQQQLIKVTSSGNKRRRQHQQIKVSHMKKEANVKAAAALREALFGVKKEETGAPPVKKEEDEAVVVKQEDEATVSVVKKEDDQNGVSKMEEDTAEIKQEKDTTSDVKMGDDDDDGDDEEEEFEPGIKIEEREPLDDETLLARTKAFKERVKEAQQKQLDKYKADVQDNVRLHEKGWKERYYTDKCKAEDVTGGGGREHLFRSYVVGLCWVMKYYYDGCPSWKWYFPFHYAPFASDLRNIERFQKDVKELEKSEPFKPVEQLMGVLPEDSSHAIPKPSRWLMSDKESPIIDFYPRDVPVDPNGKAMPWLWVVLLPFIDEDRLLSAMHPTMEKWSMQDLLCNTRGMDDGYVYIHKSHPLHEKFKAILANKSASKTRKTRFQDGMAGVRGFSGSARLPLSNELYSVVDDDDGDDLRVDLPNNTNAIKRSSHDGLFAEPIEQNVAVCVAFSEPAKLSHKSVLLPGARLPPQKLVSSQDRIIRRPQLNRRGGTIANLGIQTSTSHQAGYGSMNVSQYERDLAQRMGRNTNQTGMRAWGAMEPQAKRPRRQPPPPQQPPYNPNPFRQPRPPPPPPQSRPPWQQQQQQRTYGAYGQQAHSGYQQGQQQQQWGGSGAYNNNTGYQHQGGYQQQYNYQQNGGYQQQQQQQQQGYQQNHSYNNRNQNNRQPFNGDRRQQQQRQGYNFQSYNRSGQPPPQQQAPPQRATPNVMNSLRAQLQSTLQQHRNRNKSRR